MDGKDEIMTTEQAAEYLQVHIDTLRGYIREGRLRAAKLGKGYRIRKRDIDEFLDSLAVQERTPAE